MFVVEAGCFGIALARMLAVPTHLLPTLQNATSAPDVGDTRGGVQVQQEVEDRVTPDAARRIASQEAAAAVQAEESERSKRDDARLQVRRLHSPPCRQRPC